FADSDQDGKITEADAAAVGYNFGTGAVKPHIAAVSPLTGVTGSQLAISAIVDGTGQMTYTWDFGGAATPGTSSTPAPTITLGAVGSYSGSLKLTSEFGSDNFPFTLVVTPRPGPTADLKADKTDGAVPLTVNFDASGSTAPGGNIVQYDWSWDGDSLWEDT